MSNYGTKVVARTVVVIPPVDRVPVQPSLTGRRSLEVWTLHHVTLRCSQSHQTPAVSRARSIAAVHSPSSTSGSDVLSGLSPTRVEFMQLMAWAVAHHPFETIESSPLKVSPLKVSPSQEWAPCCRPIARLSLHTVRTTQ